MAKTEIKDYAVVSKSKNVVLRKRKNAKGYSLYLDIHVDNKRERENLGLQLTGDRVKDREVSQIAEAIKAKRIIELQTRNHQEFDTSKRDANFYLYFDEITKKKDLKNYRSCRNHLHKFTKGTILFKNVTPAWLDSFKKYLLRKVEGQNTAAVYYEAIVTVLKQAVRDDMITVNPADKVKNIARVDTHIEFLEESEIQALHSTPYENIHTYHIREAFLFSCFTGLRLSDYKALRVENIKNGRLEYIMKKTKKAHTVPLAPQAVKYIPDLKGKKPDELVFNLPESDWTVNEHLVKWGKAAKLSKKLHSHIGRHTFATLALTYGTDIYTVKELLGHANLKDTQRYAKVINPVKNKAVANLPEMK